MRGSDFEFPSVLVLNVNTCALDFPRPKSSRLAVSTGVSGEPLKEPPQRQYQRVSLELPKFT